MPIIYAVWHGGAGYAPSDLVDDLESFGSITAVRHALRDRRDLGYGTRQDFDFVNREGACVFTPCVEDDSSFWVYLGEPVQDEGKFLVPEYPDLIVEFREDGTGPTVTPA